MSDETKRIVGVTITPSVPMPQLLAAGSNFMEGGQAHADAAFDDDSVGRVLSWYDDELTFTEADFVGKTVAEVRDLFTQRDMQYLRS